jgi:hypothetical protein
MPARQKGKTVHGYGLVDLDPREKKQIELTVQSAADW